jgi:hypothetical protein
VPSTCKVDYTWDQTGLDSKFTSNSNIVFDGSTLTRTFKPNKAYDFLTNISGLSASPKQSFKITGSHRGTAIADKSSELSIEFKKDVCEVANGLKITTEKP